MSGPILAASGAASFWVSVVRPSGGKGFVLSNGQHDKYPNEDTVPLEEAFRILSHILSVGSWPPDTSWIDHLGLKAAWETWKNHRDGEDADEVEAKEGGRSSLEVAAVTSANGGDDIGVYVPVIAALRLRSRCAAAGGGRRWFWIHVAGRNYVDFEGCWSPGQ
ncbi:hypothetical protein [Streptomyces sp. NBC_01176]|uniref:hypothetical protein n=1 Tax=Streptomyces sp. NBC_01176 TaxID=2903760 RepID=UPI00386B19FD|nr:hypothetical protein OG199_42575 [Streptomyces sp. NBC_01176]